MDISLRPATENDIAFLLNLRELTMKSYLEQIGESTSEEAMLSRVRDNFDAASVIEVDGISAGIFKVRYEPEYDYWFLFQLQIVPNFQNRQLGSHLIRQLIEQAQEAGSNVRLRVYKHNPARHLYKKLGFEKISESEFELEMQYAH